MTEATSKYFSNNKGGKGGAKRKPSSTSSASDTAASPQPDKSVAKQEKKKQRQDCESGTELEMDLRATLEQMNEKLVNITTKDDFKTLEDKLDRVVATMTRRIEVLENTVFTLQKEKDELRDEVSQLKKSNSDLRGQQVQHHKEACSLRVATNDQEQHGRNWNLRVYGVKEVQGVGQETVADCVKNCVDIFSQKLGVEVSADDLELAHRSGKPGGARPRAILVRFFSRQKRSSVLVNRRKLKQTGISVSEDLTLANYKLLAKVKEHSAVLAVWSSNGKILTKLKNGKTLKLDILTDIGQTLGKAMTG